MKEKAHRDVRYIVDWILRDAPHEHEHEQPDTKPAVNVEVHDDDDDENDWYEDPALGGTNEALERSIACLYVSIHDEVTVVPYIGKLRSFAYVAAAVCMQEVERFRALHKSTR